jgi:hypothetical protein
MGIDMSVYGPDTVVNKQSDKLFAKGMLSPFCREGRYYWRIPDSLLDRDWLLVCRIEAAAAGNRSRNDGYAGDQVNTALYRFEKKNDKQLYLRRMVLNERADTSGVIFPAYRKSNVQGIVMAFDVRAYANEEYEIDVTDWLQSDTDLLYFSATARGVLRLGGQQRDKSEVLSVRAYDRNVEIRTQKTYALQGGLGMATYLLHTSLLLLPERAMIPRLQDERIGYFTLDYQDFDVNPYAVQRTRVINRWRLEPAPGDRERYFRGELVEPLQPIVFYIDPAVPRQWVKYMIQGVNAWQAAFEKAGFKNAIYAREAPAPEEDPEWSAEDGRYSVIDYKASDVANAFGKILCDPRSGEIIQSRIHFHHSLLQLLQSWYFVQGAPLDTAARSFPLGEEQMGNMIRMIISHEVGHAIGLTHNFGGTSGFSADQLRNADFLKTNGHTTSIMDYTRLNYVVQPEDGIAPELLIPRIGVYDEWAVEWGYRLYPGVKDARQETALLDRLVVEKSQDPRLRFGREDTPADPRFQAEDLGNDPMIANQLGIANLQLVMKYLKEWTGGRVEEMALLHKEVFYQYRRYLGHVLKWIGGVYETPAGKKVNGVLRKPVEGIKQQEAFDFIARNFLTAPPEWLFSPEVMDGLPESPEVSMEILCNQVFGELLNKQKLIRLLDSEGEESAYTVPDLFTGLDRTIWRNGSKKEQSFVTQRLIEKTYVSALCRLYQEKDLKNNGDLNAVLLAQLKRVQQLIARKRSSASPLQIAHRAYMQAMVIKALNS